jgi:hypothetical protein
MGHRGEMDGAVSVRLNPRATRGAASGLPKHAKAHSVRSDEGLIAVRPKRTGPVSTAELDLIF